MNCLKGLFFLFAIFCLQLSTPLHAIESSDLRTFQSVAFKGVEAYITLSDGLIFKWSPQNFEKEMLSTWKKGDIIEIVTHPNKPGILLLNINMDVVYSPQVRLIDECANALPTVETVEKVKNSTFSSMKDLHVSLSDGSCWKEEFFSEEVFFKVGDRIIVNRVCEDVSLINYTLAFTSDYDQAQLFVEPCL